MRLPLRLHTKMCTTNIIHFSSFTVYLPTSGQFVPLAGENLIYLLNRRDLPVLAQEVVLLVDQGFGLLICLVQFFGDICAAELVHITK